MSLKKGEIVMLASSASAYNHSGYQSTGLIVSDTESGNVHYKYSVYWFVSRCITHFWQEKHLIKMKKQ